MMFVNPRKCLPIVLFAFFFITIIACGGGGGGGGGSTPTPTPVPAPRLSVNPVDYSFGAVTGINTADPLLVTITNAGTADLVVSGIALSALSAPGSFSLDLNGGTTPCDLPPKTLTPGSSCNVMVEFETAALAEGQFSANLTITSNDSASPYAMRLTGSKEAITELNVTINQIDACPRDVGALVTAYVSVTDQGGYPVTGLTDANFGIVEAGTPRLTNDAIRVDDDATATLSVSLIMDYSRSIAAFPEVVTQMEDAAIYLVNQLRVGDEAQIIKYADTPEIAIPFTDDQNALEVAIRSTPDLGTHSALYDAIVMGVSEISTRTKMRRAIIVLTDGKDDNGSGGVQSVSSIDDAIADALSDGVPVFTVGLADADQLILQELADETGGTFSDAPTSPNLATIYNQLASLLFTNQYIVTYLTTLGSGVSGDLRVTVDNFLSATPGDDTRAIGVCTP